MTERFQPNPSIEQIRESNEEKRAAAKERQDKKTTSKKRFKAIGGILATLGLTSALYAGANEISSDSSKLTDNRETPERTSVTSAELTRRAAVEGMQKQAEQEAAEAAALKEVRQTIQNASNQEKAQVIPPEADKTGEQTKEFIGD